MSDITFLLRGCAKVISEQELAEKLKLGRPLRVKLGVDPTAPDIHLGHSIALSKLRDFTLKDGFEELAAGIWPRNWHSKDDDPCACLRAKAFGGSQSQPITPFFPNSRTPSDTFLEV